MAEGIMKHKIQETGNTDFTVTSMGIHGMDMQPPTDLGIQVCAEHDIDISDIKSRPLIPEELKNAHFVFVMEPFHKEFLRVFFPQCSEQTFLLAAFPSNENHKKFTIKDPVGGTLKDYRKTFETLSEHINRIFPLLCGQQ